MMLAVFFKQLFIYLGVRGTHIRAGRAFVCWFVLQRAIMARAGPGKCQKPAAAFRVPTWLGGTRTWVSFCYFPVYINKELGQK